MASIVKRISAVMLATAMVAGLAAESAFAQISPGGATVGPAGGTPSTSAPSNSEGTPSGGTGTVSNTRVGPGSTTASAPRQARRVRQRTRRARRPAAPVQSDSTGAGSSSGLNGSNAPSR